MEILVLGPVGLAHSGAGGPSGGSRRRLELGSDKERIVLASLALEPGRPVALRVLMDRLWPDEPPPGARQSAHAYVSKVRKQLLRAAGAGPDASNPPDSRSAPAVPRVVNRAHTYRLETDPDHVDWHRFQRLVDDPPGTGGDRADARLVERLTRAEELWQGEALAGLPGTWADSVRGALAEKRLGAAVTRIAARLRLGHFGDVVGELRTLTGRRPEDETLLGQLMLAYYGSGRFTEALRVHQQARRVLSAEYGASPGPELNRIHRGVLDRVPPGVLARPGAPPGGIAPVTGSARAAPRAAGSAPEPSPGPRNLPYQPPLVGRRSELRRLSAAIERAAEDGPVITLETVSGMAGVGKTAIAVHTARSLAGRFPDGQLYLDLRAHSPHQEPLTPGEALATLLRLLGAPAGHIPVELESRSALWRTMLAERRAVIVLDDAAGAEQLRPLLPGGTSSLTIITSRRHLSGLPRALPVPLDVLPADDAVALFRGFAGEERTQDIVETARIVRLCGYLPLAIEIVANRFRAHTSWTPAILGDRLARSPGRLAEIRDADTEMARAFDLSYRTLTGLQQLAFRRLGLYPGADFTADAAAALLGLSPDVTERLLEALCTFHLLREPVPDRYRYHDLLREYAHAMAVSEDPAPERAQALRRLTDFTVVSAERADRLAYPRRIRIDLADGRTPPGARGRGSARAWTPDSAWARTPDSASGPAARDHEFAPEPAGAAGSLSAPAPAPASTADAARAWFAAEHGNLLAVERYARTGGRPEAAARLAYATAGYLDAECHWQDMESVLRDAVTRWSATGDEPRLCRALTQLSAAQVRTSRYQEAAANGERALEIARLTGDTGAEAEALRILGTLSGGLGDNRRALVLFQNSFAITAQSGSGWDRARAHNNIAISLLQLGEHARALEHFRGALSGFRASDDTASVGKALNNIGQLHLHVGDFESARISYENALPILDATGNRYDRATVRRNIADILTETGSPQAALPLYRETLHEFRALGDRDSQAESLNGMGEALRRIGEHGRAAGFLGEALDIARSIGAAHHEARALCGLGRVELTRGRTDSARGLLRHALAVAARTHNADEEARVRAVLASMAPGTQPEQTSESGSAE
ncbi:tetratricopeptide repeat protein [Streptomyces sp. CAU 1734]|uniref:AfsR/SARP family transcriptional regulator n=1 Tax=Streptomyces sp. CAU 1734 TaxID=3140360 RepID=UPI0032610394